MTRGLKATTVIKKGGEYAIAKKKAKMHRPPRALYTEDEKKEMSRLRAQNRYYRKRISALIQAADTSITLKDIRSYLSEDLAYELCKRGYFNEPDYSTRDFREWMTTNGDLNLLQEVLDEVNALKADPNSHITPNQDDIDDNTKAKINAYNDKINKNNERLTNMKQSARDRKDANMLRYMDERSQIQTGEKLLDAISKGKIVVDKLSDPEQAAIRYAKNTVIKTIFDNIDFDKLPEDYVPVIKRTIYTSVMENPVQGLRDAVRGTVAIEAAKKYGNDAANFAAGLTDTVTSVITGKPNAVPALKSAFGYMISKSPMSKGLMQEVSEDLINSGQSTNDKENSKMLARDVAVDIAKDLITTGGNIYAAIPMILKDVLIDTSQAGIRKIKYDNLKSKEELKQIDKKVKQKQQNNTLTEDEINELLKKYEK